MGTNTLTLIFVVYLTKKTADCGLGIRVSISTLSRALTATSNRCTTHFTHTEVVRLGRLEMDGQIRLNNTIVHIVTKKLKH